VLTISICFLKIAIEHVIGWDSKAGTGNINKGAFGK
jgi:hypothetical protein